MTEDLTTATPSTPMTSISKRFVGYIKEDGLFWGLIISLSFAMGILCLHAAAKHGWHDYYFTWTYYLLLSPSILVIKWLNDQVNINLDAVDSIVKFIIGFSLAYNVTPVLLTTPHAFIDRDLLQVDQWLHINSLSLLKFTHQHPLFHDILFYCYTRLDGSFILLILIFAILGEKRLTQDLLTMSLIALFVAAITFYFFPSFGPLTLLHNLSFPNNYASIVTTQYHIVQQGLPLDMQHYYAGFVAMPSIHTFIASVAIYAIVSSKRLRWFLSPLIIFNLLIITSTLFLAEHYVADLIAAELLLAGIVVCYKLIRDQSRH